MGSAESQSLRWLAFFMEGMLQPLSSSVPKECDCAPSGGKYCSRSRILLSHDLAKLKLSPRGPPSGTYPTRLPLIHAPLCVVDDASHRHSRAPTAPPTTRFLQHRSRELLRTQLIDNSCHGLATRRGNTEYTGLQPGAGEANMHAGYQQFVGCQLMSPIVNRR
ncbi:hypothetical protein MKEN_00209900 [Mycena kentingensis (nom. inval.)]|nr:hypothetical protein MKEN_00209900 [Mycena kentingensis (nom. inval.)]